MKLFTTRTSLCNFICVLLMFVLLVFQFTPFWNIEGETAEAVSIGSYVWFPTDNGALDDYLKERVGNDFAVESILAMPLVTLFLGIIGMVVCLVKADKFYSCLIPAVVGLVGTVAFLTTPALQLGSGWVMQLILYIVTLAVSVTGIVFSVKDR